MVRERRRGGVLQVGLTVLSVLGLALWYTGWSLAGDRDRSRDWEVGGIYLDGVRICTGSYSSSRDLVITAGHCVDLAEGRDLRYIAADGDPNIDLPEDLTKWRIDGDVAQFGKRPIEELMVNNSKRLFATHYALTFPVRLEGEVLYRSEAGTEGAGWMPSRAPVYVWRVISFPGMSGTLVFDRLHDRPIGVLVGGMRGTDVTIVALFGRVEDTGRSAGKGRVVPLPIGAE